MAEKGWDAKGLLQPLWSKYPGGRDGLADAVGTTGNSLSARNTGKRSLGLSLGTRLAEELKVSLLELGAPLEAADEAGLTLVDRLEELATKLADSVARQLKTEAKVTRLQARVRVLEAAREGGAAVAKGQS